MLLLLPTHDSQWNDSPQETGLDDINTSIPVELHWELLVTIGRTARVARFIRASTVVKTSSKVNWYWLYQRINPMWYWQAIRRRASTRNIDPDGMNGDGQNDGSGGGSKGPRSLVRQGSWGGVQLGVLAAVKKAQLEEDRKMLPQEKGFFAMIRRGLRAVGILRNDDEEIRRQIAATKIQRVWRATVNLNGRPIGNSDSREDEAWAPNRSLGGNPVERVMQKRSIMRQFNSRAPPVKNRRSMMGLSIKNGNKNGTTGRRQPESQVGSAMRELTGQRVAIGIIVALILTVLFTYSEADATRPSTMVILHNQTNNAQFAERALDAAFHSSIPDLYRYTTANGTILDFKVSGENPNRLRDREKLQIEVLGPLGSKTVGLFAYQSERQNEALVQFISTIFILLVWFFGVTAFAGPVMTLVVIPIERMVRLLGMLMLDPLGYQSTPRYKKFVAEEEELTKNTRWTKEVLKGMET